MTTVGEDSFVEFVGVPFKDLDSALIRRITTVVNRIYRSRYELNEFADQRSTPVVAFKGSGNDYSFIENSRGYSVNPPTVVTTPKVDRDSVLPEPDGHSATRSLVGRRLETGGHHAKHRHRAFPKSEERQTPVTSLTKAMRSRSSASFDRA